MRIRSQDLSKTFQDAVEVVRDLGLSYIWIDSLCIIQDDNDDWEREAALMTQVYREALCTICALSSNDGDGGCRVNGSNEEVKLLRYVDLDLGEYRIRLVEDQASMDMLNWDLEYGDDDFKVEPWGNNPLRARGWAFQERELSVRAVHFSKHTLLWECLEMKGSTEIPYGVTRGRDESLMEPKQTSSSDAGAADRDQWYGKVEDYTSRFLTYESDKLVAFAGYAQHFRREVLGGGIYLAGLWKEHFPGCLLWKVRRELRFTGDTHPFSAFEPRRPMKYRAPSWSWASLDGEVTYTSQREAYRGGAPVRTSRFSANILRNDIDLEDSFSRVPPSASITMRGKITQGMFDYKLEDTWDMYECKMQLYNKLGDDIGFFYPDIMLEVRSVGHIWCLGVCDEADNSLGIPLEISSAERNGFSERLMGIALCPASDEGLFRRVGLVRWMKKSAFDDVSLSEVKII